MRYLLVGIMLITALLGGCGSTGGGMAEYIYLVEIDAYNPSIAGVTTLRFCTGTGYVTNPADTPANTPYLPRVTQAGSYTRNMFKKGTTGGATETGYGETVVSNPDGYLDPLINYGYDGRRLEIKMGRPTDPLSAFVTVQKGTLEQPNFEWGKISFKLRDYSYRFQRPAQSNLYLGNNTDLEGDASLQAKPKPLMYASVAGMEPICVSASKLIYQYDDPSAHTSVYTHGGAASVLDRGVDLTAGADYVSVADMIATPPAPGTWRNLASGGYFRLGSPPAGKIVVQGIMAVPMSLADIVTDLVRGPGQITTTMQPTIAVPSAGSYEHLGIVAGSNQNIDSMLDELCASNLCWWGFNRLGEFVVGRIYDPATQTPVTTITKADMIGNPERTSTADSDAGIPVWRVTMQYRKNYAPMAVSDFAGSIDPGYRAALSSEWLSVQASNTSVQTAHLLSPEITWNCLHTRIQDANFWASAVLNLYSVRRDRLNVKIHVTPDIVPLVDLGTVLQVKFPRWGYDAGKNMMVIGITPDLRRNAFDLVLWG